MTEGAKKGHELHRTTRGKRGPLNSKMIGGKVVQCQVGWVRPHDTQAD